MLPRLKSVIRRIRDKFSDGAHGPWDKWARWFEAGIDQTAPFALKTMTINNERRAALQDQNNLKAREMTASHARTYICGAAMCWAQSQASNTTQEERDEKVAKAEEYLAKAEGLLE
jgi:hypothetical protein